MGTIKVKGLSAGVGVNFGLPTLNDMFGMSQFSITSKSLILSNNKSNSVTFSGTGLVGSGSAGHLTTLTAGTINSVQILVNGVLVFDASGITVNAPTLFNAWKANPTAPSYLYFLGGNDTITGTAFADVLLGGAGNDQLDGGAGADTLKGGTGNDTYIIDNIGDIVDETTGSGVDLVQSAVSFSLSDAVHTKGDVENLTLIGSLSIDGTGNSLANVINGNAMGNVIEGKGGADTLDGAAGIDTLSYASSLQGVTITLNGATQMTGAGGDAAGDKFKNFENVTGSGQVDRLTGDKLDNVIDGRGGADQMTGGAGNDTYVVDNSGDTVIELAKSGSDLVLSSVTFTLSAEVENLTLTGAGAIDGTGNILDNLITGNDSKNSLSGLGGNDTLKGLGGDDTLLGGVGSDTLEGGAGKDRLVGGAGADKLTGGAGGDTFVYLAVSDSAAAKGAFDSKNGDTVTEFTSAAETTIVADRDHIDLTGVERAINHTLNFGAGPSAYGVWTKVGSSTTVLADTTGDSVADLVINIATKETLSASDFLLDITPPAPGTLSFSNLLDSGSSSSDRITNDNNFNLALAGNENGSTVAFQLSTDGGAHWSATTTNQTALADGTYQYRAVVSDAAGNSANSNAVSVTIDKTAPVSGTLAFSNLTDSGSSSSDRVTNDNSLDLTLTGKEIGSTVAYQVSNDGGPSWNATTAIQNVLADGTYQYKAVVTDVAGNSSTSNAVNVTIDTTAPVASITLDPIAGNNLVNVQEGAGTITITGLVGGDVQNGDVVTLGINGHTYTGAVSSGIFSIDVSGADLRNDIDTTVNASATTKDLAGNSTTAVQAASYQLSQDGAAVDGYITGATVFADANGNGILDVGEASTTTDASGNFVLVGGSGSLVLQGGTDISTGLNFAGTLLAPEGAAAITPLSTLVASVAATNGGDVASAEALVKTVLGLSGIAGSLSDYDPVKASLSGDASGNSAITAAIVIQNTIGQAAALLSGAGATGAEANAAALAAIVEHISSNTDVQLDLGNSTTLVSILSSAASSLSSVSLDASTIDGAADVMHAVNTASVEASSSATTAGELLTVLAQIQVVVHTDLNAALVTAGSTNDSSEAVSGFTGNSLGNAVDAAAGLVQNIYGGITGTGDADTLIGTNDTDVLNGLAGSDTLIGHGGDDILVGGAGADTYVWSAGDGEDTIVASGAANEDVIKLEGGFYDYDFRVEGNDLLVTGVADDSYTYEGGFKIQNFLTGGDSVAYVEGDFGQNNQFYSPGGGLSHIYLSALNGTNQGNNFEVVVGSNAGETMTGGGGTGTDKLIGRGGDDVMSVSDGTRGVLVGGDGNDTMTGAYHDNDVLRGGAGNDNMDGGAGAHDTVRYQDQNGSAAFSHGAFVNLSGASATYDFNGNATTVAAGHAIDNWGDTDTLSNIEDIQGSNYADILIGDTGANDIQGRDGNDIIIGGGNTGLDSDPDPTNFDILRGGSGADSFVFGTEAGVTHIQDFVVGTDVLRFKGDVGIASLEEQNWDAPWGPTTVVTLTTGAKVMLVSVSGIADASVLVAPPITGTADPETLTGSGFNDTLVGGQGDDILVGGAGADTYVWSAGDGEDTIVASGAANEDVIKLEGSFYDYDWQIQGNDLFVTGVADDSYTDVGGLKIQNFFGGSDSVAYIEGDFGQNNQGYSPNGGLGRIYLSVLNGTDQGNHWEAVFGTSGNDVMTGGGGASDNLYGMGGDDTLSGSDGTHAWLIGGDGNDTLIAANHDYDQLRGGAGNDIMDGGAGAHDRANYHDKATSTTAFTHGAFVNLSGASATYDFNGTPTTVAAGHAIDNWGDTDTLSNIEDIRGSEFADVLIGTSGTNNLNGHGGNDVIVGGGNTGLLSDPDGWMNFDYLNGGSGADSFVFGSEAGVSVIEDFAVGTDILRFAAGVSIATMEEQPDWAGPGSVSTVITLSSGATIVLQNVVGLNNNPSALLAAPIEGTSDPETLTGTSFSDTLVGGQGDDILVGGAGADTYVWSAGDGEDTIVASGAANEDVIKLEGSFYDYDWHVDGNDLLVTGVADDSYTWDGAVRIENFFTGGDSVAYMDIHVTPDNQPYSDTRIYLSAVNGTAQGDHFEWVFGTNASEIMTGGGGGAGTDKLFGFGGNDTMSVSDGTRGVLLGGDGDDTLTGANRDNDSLRGGAGNDIMDGGAGAHDRVEYKDRYTSTTGFSHGAFVNLSGASATYDFNGNATTVAAGHAIDNWGDTDTLSNIEDIQGSNYADVLIGTGGANNIQGRDGNDVIVGGGGDDFLIGGTGADSFVFDLQDIGNNVIQDYIVSVDNLVLSSGLTIETLIEFDTNSDSTLDSTLVTLSNSSTILLQNVLNIADPGDLLA